MNDDAAARLTLLTTALEAAANGVVITDADGIIVWTNRAFTRSSGWSRKEAIGRTPGILRSGEHDQAFYDELWRTIGRGEVWSGEIVNRRHDGSLYEEAMTITPVRVDGERITHFIAIKEDVTERRSLEAQLRHAQKMDALGRLAGGVAHDFNNLLTVINGQAEMAAMAGPPPRVREAIDEILAAGRRAAALTGHLLAVGRRSMPQRTRVDLDETVREEAALLQRVLGDRVVLVTRPAGVPCPVDIDPALFGQVLINLVLNARDAMADEGTVTVETAVVDIAESDRAAADGLPAGRYVEVAVRDEGCGIDPAVREQIFEPFFTTRRERGGSGLGLAIVYGIVRQFDGAVAVESEPGLGSTFRVRLPLATGVASAVTARRASPLERHDHAARTVLVVEDEPAVRALARSILAERGYRVLTAADGPEAVAHFDDESGRIDLVLTDLVMPGMSGSELARALRLRRPDLRCVYMSGYSDEETLQRHVAGDATPFLQKPFDVRALLVCVDEALDD